MAEILHHLTCMKPYKWIYINDGIHYHINWCKISAINSMMGLPVSISVAWEESEVSFQAATISKPGGS